MTLAFLSSLSPPDMKINPVYIVMLLGLVLVAPLARQLQQRPTEFYGIAQTPDLDLSLPYNSQVAKLLVREGQAVDSGQVLAEVYRPNLSWQQATQQQDLAGLEAEVQLQITRQRNKIVSLEQQQYLAEQELQQKIRLRVQQLQRQASLLQQFESLGDVPADTAAWRNDPSILRWQQELQSVAEPFTLELQQLRSSLASTLAPLQADLQKQQLQLQALDEAETQLLVRSPRAGVVGVTHFIVGEEVKAHQPLLNLYQHHPDQVSAYIPEGQLSEVLLGDELTVQSIQSPDYQVTGKVIGLGNKIKALPTRMRRDPNLEAWGREVQLAVPANNAFMQGERVLIVVANEK